MDMVRKILGLILIALLAINMASVVLAEETVDKDARSAEVLIENAERLKQLIEVKLQVINYVLLNFTASGNVTVYINNTLSLILEYKAEGDAYLNISKTLYEEGNYTGAKTYAIKAMQSYCKALKLIHELSVELGIKYEKFCKEEGVINRTRMGIVNNSLIVAFKIAEMHVDRLIEIIEELNKTGIDYDFEVLLEELAEIKALIEEGMSLAEAGNTTEAAHILREVRKRIVYVNAELHRLSMLIAVKKLRKFIAKKFGGENATLIDYILEEFMTKLRGGGLKGLFGELKKVFHEILKFKEGFKGKKPKLPIEPPTPPGGGGGGEGGGHKGGHGH